MSQCYYANLPIVYDFLYSLKRPSERTFGPARPTWKTGDDGVSYIELSPSEFYREYSDYGSHRPEKLMDSNTVGKFLTSLAESYNGFDKKRLAKGVVYHINEDAIDRIIADKIECNPDEVHEYLDCDD